MRKIRIYFLIIGLVPACDAFSAAYWSDAGGDRLWSNPDNWTAASFYRPPASSDTTYIKYSDLVPGGQGPVIQDGINAVARSLAVEVGSGSLIEMTMTGGTLTIYNPGSTGCYFRLGAGSSSGKVVFNMSGGVLRVDQDDGNEGYVRIGYGYTGEMYMSNDATVYALSLMIASDTNSFLDMRDNAQVILKGDHRTAVEDRINSGRVRAWGGDGTVLVDYDATQPGKTVIWAVKRTETPVLPNRPVPNPVIPKLADSGVMRYNGEYYIIGTGSSGDMRRSDNLVNWGPREHVFSMNNEWATGEAGEDSEIHACDISYRDGIFHLYWSVNRSDIGVRHIGHAVSESHPMGPYTEPVTSTYFADYIDAHLFQDADGSCYFYTVKFPHGNTVYGQGMSDPWTRTGTDRKLLWLPSTGYPAWEWVDSERVNEAPFVIRYRGTYYMLYNANATWNPNYSIGCAVSDTPLGFAHADKYADPVLSSTVRGEHSITHIGQPSVVRGPNGFEWWLVYFAKYDDSSKSQAIDRILFFDRKLHVTGPSCNLPEFSAGTYTPPPASPTLGDLFNEGTALADHWNILSGTWGIDGGQARSMSPGENRALIRSRPARHYLVEAGVRMADSAAQRAGLTAYYKDADNWLAVGFDQSGGGWYYQKMEHGIVQSALYPLDGNFNFTVYHHLRVTKNDSAFEVQIDDRPAPGNPVIGTNFDGEGLPGFYTDNASACFDGFVYTIGWDEWDEGIRGWGNAAGDWAVGSGGIETAAGIGTSRIFKGDWLSQYEFMVQATDISEAAQGGNSREMGIYAIFTDDQNWLRAGIDRGAGRLKVYGMKDGVETTLYDASVDIADSYHLRVIRREGGVRLFVDGQLAAATADVWGASQVGLYARNLAARFNGITCFGLCSQYGDEAARRMSMEDDFDDNLLDPLWQQVPLHRQDISKQNHNTLPDIVIHESGGRLRFSGSEKGDDGSTWYGRGLKYNRPVYGSSISEFTFDSLRSHSRGAARAAIGLRLQKDLNNWFEVRQTDDQDGDRLEYTVCKNGAAATSSILLSNASGRLKVKFTNSGGVLEYFLNGMRYGIVSMPGLKNSEYYVYITAYTSNADNEIDCRVDDFRIRTLPADLNDDWEVNLEDLAALTDQWLRDDCETAGSGCGRCDIDQDGAVDLNDLGEMAKDWLSGPQ